MPAADPGGSPLDELLALIYPWPRPQARRVTEALKMVLSAKLVAAEADEASGQLDIAPIDADILLAQQGALLAAQLDAILHEPTVLALEVAWRSLARVVAGADPAEGVVVEMLDVSKARLMEDFDDAADTPSAGLFRVVYSREYGSYGGEPIGLLCSLYSFDGGPTDVALLHQIADVAAAAHAPFLAAAEPTLLGCETWPDVSSMQELRAIFDGPQSARWRSLCASENARYLYLTLPRFLLRAPYGPNGRKTVGFPYRETILNPDRDLAWGSGAVLLAVAAAECHRRYRWSPNLLGVQVPNTETSREWFGPYHGAWSKCPVEVLLDEGQEREAASMGLVAILFNRVTDAFFFLSTSSVQTLAPPSEAGADALSRHLGGQLHYLLIAARLAHYLKVLQRDTLGMAMGRADLARELNKWLRQYISDQESPGPAVRAQRPLRQGTVGVEPVPGELGWYRVTLKIRPHFRYNGASFEVALVGRLDVPRAGQVAGDGQR